ncbi:MAG: lysine--tRNA ligase [Deltaproteobacteria bacterium]|nr:lysine--tRNA ligase [Deltaproteobacteria bacterium]
MASPPKPDPAPDDGAKPAEPVQIPIERLMAERAAKVDELRQAGVNPYANDVRAPDAIGDVRGRFPDAVQPPDGGLLAEGTFRVAGRIVAVRAFGGSTFLKLRDRSGEIQVWLRKDRLGATAYALFKKLERGDYLFAKGPATVTKTGELSILADEFKPLTKAIRPLPEKWHGLSDVEARYRQHYLDLVTNPEVADVFRARSRIIGSLRKFLDGRGFLEVETPMMHSVLGGAAARPFRTHHHALDLPMYLRIAPELFLKRLVVGGFERVYEIGRNFRNEGLSRQHNPEFTMLELYQSYATFEDMIELTEELFAGLLHDLGKGDRLSYQGQEVDFTRPWPRIAVRQAVATALGVGLAVVKDPDALLQLIRERELDRKDDEVGTALRKAESHGERLGALFDYMGEQTLPADRPVFVVEYPAETSPLARRNDTDPNFVDRFELFIVGREHANAFSELNDPADQRARFQRQVERKDKGDQEAMEYDEDYCRALEFGMPPTAGEGIGVDRLVMLLCDQPSIRDVVLFPLMRPEGGPGGREPSRPPEER